MNINKNFNEVFRKIPNIYNKRKFYHKSFKYIRKLNYSSYKKIDVFLFYMKDFNDEPSQLKTIINRIRLELISIAKPDNNLIIFLQSILDDMSLYNESPISTKNLKYYSYISYIFMDVSSLYPKNMICGAYNDVMILYASKYINSKSKTPSLKDSAKRLLEY